jgi:poly-gamma-glutamate synthase PgsB/CapB
MRCLLPCLLLFLLYLIAERVALFRSRRRIPLLIAVTGTRGKSAVARLLASILQNSGRRVLAKTTGSQAAILFPDGSQVELQRHGIPSILEQKLLIGKAARSRPDCLIAEVMSIHPENHYVESHRILQPDILIITNVRRDHTDAMGETEDEIASVLSLDICRDAEVYLPEAEARESFRAECRRCRASLHEVPGSASRTILQGEAGPGAFEFEQNIDLACAVAIRLGVDVKTIREGIRRVRYDIGGLRVWRYRPEDSGGTCYLVNAFAANDPQSTMELLSKVTPALSPPPGGVIGILNLREDRPARTLQWVSFLREGALDNFGRLFVAGRDASVARRRLPGALPLRSRSPRDIMRIVCADAPDRAVIFGFGNIKGCGRLLVDHWCGNEALYEPYECGGIHAV